MFPIYCYLSRFRAHLNLHLVFLKLVLTCIFAITFLKALAFYRFISANQLNSLTWESTSELCSHFNLQVSWCRFLELATPNDWTWGKLNYCHWICHDCDSCSLWTFKLALIGMCKALTLVKKSQANFDSSTKRNWVQLVYDTAGKSWNCVAEFSCLH